jgi:hypothetical protein
MFTALQDHKSCLYCCSCKHFPLFRSKTACFIGCNPTPHPPTPTPHSYCGPQNSAPSRFYVFQFFLFELCSFLSFGHLSSYMKTLKAAALLLSPCLCSDIWHAKVLIPLDIVPSNRTHSRTLFLISYILILFFRVRLSIGSVLSSSGFLTIQLYKFYASPVHATCTAHLILFCLCLITLTELWWWVRITEIHQALFSPPPLPLQCSKAMFLT